MTNLAALSVEVMGLGFPASNLALAGSAESWVVPVASTQGQGSLLKNAGLLVR
jgi:hypothetical protein